MGSVLVTGGAGFIGSHVVERLVVEGVDVRVLDDFSTGRRENLRSVLPAVEIMEGDVADTDTVRRAVMGCRRVIHLAAVASVQASLDDPLATHAINLRGTVNVLEAARVAGVERVVLASSASVYGDHTRLPLHEELPFRPLSPYAADKAAGETYCRAFYAAYGLETVALRFFNVYGPRQDPHSPYTGVISIFVDRMRSGEPPVIYGDGQQTRDFVYVVDVARAVLLAASCSAAGGETCNVASGTQTSILALVDALNDVLGTDFAPRFAPPRVGEVRFSEGDAACAQRLLGWRPEWSLKEGLSQLVATPS
jgi:UDP-glucose 4-epimerase